MKRILVWVLALSLALSLAACSSGGGNGGDGNRVVNVCGWGENIDPDQIGRASCRERVYVSV